MPFSSDIEFLGLTNTNENPLVSIIENKSLKRCSDKRIYHFLNLQNSVVENISFTSRITNGAIIEYNFFQERFSNYQKQIKLLHQSFPSVLFQNGYHVIHGCAFMHNDSAMILSGPSGSGKSETLNLLKKKFKIISDDIVALNNVNGEMFCSPGIPLLCVKQNLQEMPLNDKRGRSIKIVKAEQMTNKNYRVSKIFFLEWGNHNTLEKISNTDSFKNLLANSFRSLPSMNCPTSENIFLKNLSNIIKNTSQYIFKRKRGNIENSVTFFQNTLDELK